MPLNPVIKVKKVVNNMNKKTIIITIIIVILAILALTSRNGDDNKDFISIGLYPGYEWEEVSVSSLDDSLRSIAVTKDSLRSVLLPGVAHRVIIESPDTESFFQILEDFRSYTISRSEGNDWLRSVDSAGVKISPIFADGPSSSVYGFVKSIGDNIFLYQISERWLENSQNEFTFRLECPCKYEITIFESLPVSINDLASED
jgi:hypothetical protein